MAVRICASVGCGFLESNSEALTIMPLKQYPHCTACSSIIACWTGCNSGAFESLRCEAYQAGSPSSVVTDLPATADTGVTHERVSTPFTNTEQDPHCASPQPNRGPRNINSLESTYSSGVSGEAATFHTRSFTRIFNSPAIPFSRATSVSSLFPGRDQGKRSITTAKPPIGSGVQ